MLLAGRAGAQPTGGDEPKSEPTPPDGDTKPDEPAPPPAPTTPAATTGLIKGTVESPDLEAPLAGATVTIGGTTATATTDDEGHFEIVAPPGNAHLRVEITGF